jgi:hypothetical protein
MKTKKGGPVGPLIGLPMTNRMREDEYVMMKCYKDDCRER